MNSNKINKILVLNFVENDFDDKYHDTDNDPDYNIYN